MKYSAKIPIFALYSGFVSHNPHKARRLPCRTIINAGDTLYIKEKVPKAENNVVPKIKSGCSRWPAPLARVAPEEHINLKTMCAMKKNFINTVAMVAVAAIATLTSCVSSLYSSSNSYDDLYAVHDVEVIAAREKAEAEVRKAEAEARRAEALAEQAKWEAEQAKQQALLAQNTPQTQQQTTASAQNNGLIVVEESGNDFVANSYESAYARRLRGFQSASYRMPSSYYSLRYNGNVTYATAYDPAFYNIMVSGDEVWVEPKYITSMFGTWGATRATVVLSPWYYGWRGWSSFYDPWYYSCWGFPRYSWWDWNWNICYGSHWGGWGINLWWGWGGLYRPWHHHHHHYGWYGHHHHHGGFWYGDMWGGGGGHWYRGGDYYGSRNNNSRLNGGGRAPSRGSAVVNRGSANSTPYRSPNSGSVYGNTSRTGRYASALEQQRNGSVGRGTTTGSRSGSAVSSQSSGRTTTTNRSQVVTNDNSSQRNNNSSRNNSTSRSSYNSSSSSSSSYSNSSSFSSGSRGGGGSYSGGGGYSGGSSGGGGSRGGGSRGR